MHLPQEALERFGRMVTALGGPADFAETPARYLPAAPIVQPVMAERDGVVQRLKVRDIGLAVVAIGGGRTRADQRIDPAVGLTAIVKPGTRVRVGDVLAMAHVRDDTQLADVRHRLQAAMPIGDEPVTALKAVYDRIGE